MRRALVLLLSLLALALPRAAHARSIVIRDFRSDARVNADGTVDVTETLRVYFEGSWNGILRDVSLQSKTGQNRRTKLELDDITVTDETGTPLEYWLEKPDSWTRRIRVRVPGASDAERTVVIHYRVPNAVRHFYPGDVGGEHDELYWNATGNTSQFPIEHALARITTPPGAYPTREAAYTGPAGNTGSDADLRVGGSIVTAEESRTLEPGEGVTLAVAWPAGAIPRPSESEVRAQATLAFWPLLLPFLAFALMFRHWWRHGRDPSEHAIVVQYEPPEGMTPAELGTLVDNRADLRDITSTLVDLAVRGFIGIEERKEKHLMGLVSTKEWVFHQRTDSTTGLQTHERRFIDALFATAETGPAWGVVKEQSLRAAATPAGGGDAADFADGDALLEEQPFVKLSDLKNQFYKSLPPIRQGIFERLIERGYYLRRPDEVKGFWTAIGIVLMIGGGLAGAFLGDAGILLLSPLPVALGVVGSGFIVMLFGLAMAARTEKGARAREAALGFREFLSKVESDRYRKMITSPELFERFLPHAMAFGVEARWARAFEGLYREAPEWYAGTGYYGQGFSASSFSSSMTTLGSSAASTMSSSPSGSGGGGSSGGGSGGGGVGGW